MRGRRAAAAAAMAAAVMGAATTAQAAEIRVQGTTDTVDAGLINGVTYPGQDKIPGLKDRYEAKHPGDTINYTAVGTGAALTNARNGLADLVITHAPSLEKRFVDDGYALGKGKQIFYSDYVIVGPMADPAGVATAARHDAVGAFEAIAAAGSAATPTATFLSRDNASGTNVQEQIIWGLTDGAKVATEQAANAGNPPDTSRKTPTAPANDGWYKRNRVGQGQNVRDTSACAAATYPNGGCYTMTDRGTYNNLVNSGVVTNLKIVADVNAADARGGPDLLINPFGGYVLDPAAQYPQGSPDKNVEGAQRLLDYITSAEFQTYLESFPTAVDPAFRPDAFPGLTLDAGLPQTAANGTALTVAGTLRNRVPGGGLAVGMAPTLQASTDGGATWTDVVTGAATAADGRFSVSTTLAGTTAYRLSLPASAATSYSFFTESTVPLGTVTATAPSDGGGTPPGGGTTTPGTTTPGGGTTPPPTVPAADTTRPRLSRIALSRRSVRVRVSEAGTVRVTVQRRTVKRVRRGGKVRRVTRYRTVRTLTIRTTGARTTIRRIKRLSAGRYRVRVRATDTAGNTRSATSNQRVRKARS